jgi:hypothetical protein
MKNERMTPMKRAGAAVLPLLLATVAFGQDSSVHWGRIVGVITAPGTSNTAAGIQSGGPWTATQGSAAVNLTTAEAAFSVEGLSLVGGNDSGTPGPVTSVKGTLVCNPGASDQAVVDTPAVSLSPQGNATFSGYLESVPPSTCTNPLFLIRVPTINIYIATGAVRKAGY